ncbi:helix-turn-helix domain-containing protein [Floridanema evergladense]|uniref:Helix-turn-helix domain-containing protein n=1 Tax=Floridaenema evergladense BLCC-F167 TaxID=3153639 RepID=A0ABV4WG84_9CYAN
MNKQEAADFLGVSVRALERYVSQGRISVRYEKGKTRPTANFDEQELEAFKQELNQPTYKPRQIPTPSQVEEDTALTHSGEVSEFGEITAIDKLAGIIEKLLQREFPSVPVADKLLLTISEAQALTGLSREILREAIATGELKAKVIGKGWKIKRSDLDKFIDELS